MRRKPARIGVLFSGGLDSAALIGHLLEQGQEVWPVYVKSGLRWEPAELNAARKFLRSVSHRNLKPLRIATLFLETAYRNNWSQTGRTPGSDSNDRAVFLPARNLLLLTKSLLSLFQENVSTLAIATLGGNPFPDGKPSYFKLVQKVLTDGFMRRVRIEAPFRGKTKASIIRAARNYPLYLSTSCISPRKGLHCGRCNKCAERMKAFSDAGVKDKTRYAAGQSQGIKRSS